MIRCASCGAEAQPHYKFCLKCGEELPPPGAAPQGPPVLYPPGMGGPPPQFQVPIPGPGSMQGAPRRSPTIWIAIAFAVMAAAGAFFFLQTSRSPSSSSSTASSAPATTVPVVPQVPQAPSSTGPSAEPSAAFPGVRVPTAKPASPTPADTTSTAPTPEPAPAGRRPVEPAIDSDPPPETQPAVVADPGLPATPSRDDVRTKFESIRGAVRACVAGGAGTARAATVIEGATGRVTSVEVTGDFTGPAATCLENAIRGLNFGPFANETQTVTFPYRF
jgi:hypothetical protein